MSDLNLIPQSWNQGRTVKRSLLKFGIAYGVVAVGIVMGSVFLANRIEAESEELERLRGDKDSALAQRARLDVLTARKDALAREVKTLQRLGGTPDVRRVFSTVEQSLGKGVWFREWVFRRAGEFVDVGPKTVETGFLILVPARTDGETPKGWRVKTHMEIRGEALSHSALAVFVRRLSRSPEVAEVRILDSRSVMSEGARVVGFDVAVVVRERGTQA